MIFGDRKAIKPHEAHELFWLTLELNVLPMCTWTFSGQFLNVNQALLDMIGYTREEFEGGEISWKALTPPGYTHLEEKCIKELAGQHIAIPFEKEFVRKDGSRIHVRLHSATHDFGASGKGVSIIVPLD